MGRTALDWAVHFRRDRVANFFRTLSERFSTHFFDFASTVLIGSKFNHPSISCDKQHEPTPKLSRIIPACEMSICVLRKLNSHGIHHAQMLKLKIAQFLGVRLKSSIKEWASIYGLPSDPVDLRNIIMGMIRTYNPAMYNKVGIHISK